MKNMSTTKFTGSMRAERESLSQVIIKCMIYFTGKFCVMLARLESSRFACNNDPNQESLKKNVLRLLNLKMTKIK